MFINKYPYTDTHELNLDWILAEVKRLQERIDNFEGIIMDELEAYVDNRLQDFNNALNNFESYVSNQLDSMTNNIDDFERLINNEVSNLSAAIDGWEARLEADINAVNARTDIRIQENNDYILSHITEELGQIKVINYFNGQEIALQDMLDILASYHLADPLTYTLLASKNKTYTELAAYNMTYSQYINSGNAIIV